MSTIEIANRYTAFCKEGKSTECIDTLFAEDAVSVEAGVPPGMERTANGRAAIHGKGKWWVENHIVHKAEIEGPFPHDDRFAMYFVYDITQKASGKRITMKEVALFTVKNDKITREEFFYQMGG